MSTTAWQLFPASFRGAAFHVAEHETTFGRRGVVHEYPLRDKPYFEDLGRKARALTFEAMIVGADYVTRRDALLKAVEQVGPGKLVHPYLGEMTVNVTEARLRETTAEGGIARITLTVVEAGEFEFPSAARSTSGATLSAAQAHKAQASADFTDRFSVDERASFVVNSAAASLQSAFGVMRSAAATIQSASDAVAAVTRDIDDAISSVLVTVTAPAAAAQALVGNVNALVQSVIDAPRNAVDMAARFFDFGSAFAAVPTTTANRRQQAVNQAETVRLVRGAALAEAAAAATAIEFTSFDDAAELRELLVNLSEELMEATDLSDAQYSTLANLRAAIVRDISARGADLARLVAYTTGTTMPALVLAQRLYADASRDAELIARNAVRHPGFVPGGVALEVLSDG